MDKSLLIEIILKYLCCHLVNLRVVVYWLYADYVSVYIGYAFDEIDVNWIV